MTHWRKRRSMHVPLACKDKHEDHPQAYIGGAHLVVARFHLRVRVKLRTGLGHTGLFTFIPIITIIFPCGKSWDFPSAASLTALAGEQSATSFASLHHLLTPGCMQSLLRANVTNKSCLCLFSSSGFQFTVLLSISHNKKWHTRKKKGFTLAERHGTH